MKKTFLLLAFSFITIVLSAQEAELSTNLLVKWKPAIESITIEVKTYLIDGKYVKKNVYDTIYEEESSDSFIIKGYVVYTFSSDGMTPTRFLDENKKPLDKNLIVLDWDGNQ